MKILIDNQPAIGLYDSGSNISLINYDYFIKRKLNKNISGGNIIKTISGDSISEGVVSVDVRIFNITEKVKFFIVKSNAFKEDVLLGLDCIKKFKLCQNYDLKISQNHQEMTNQVNNISNEIDKPDFDTTPEVKKLLEKFSNIFAKDKFDVGSYKNFEATVKLTENKYISKKPYKCALQDQLEIESQIKKLLTAGLVEESNSPNASPVTLAFKKGEARRSRLCIDYRELNKIVVPESQPFPRIDDLTLRVRNCKYYSKLDINSAFLSISLREKDRYKTAFVTHHGHWQWRRLPFGLKTAPAIFQRALSGVLRKYNLNSFAINYIDDILIFSENYDDHLKHIELTLQALSESGFKLNSKCEFLKREIVYLGHEIGYNSIKPLVNNVVAIKNFPVPKTKKNIQQFLGKVNFYLEYIPQSTVLLEPFHNLLRKNVEFKWTEICQKNFDKVKNYLCTEPILAIFDPALEIHIFTDASIEGVGAVLKQPQSDGILKPVFYFSRKLTKSQKAKRAIYLECLAIKEAILYWQYHLIGSKFIVHSDHKPLENFNVKNCSDPELRQILNYISQYDFVIKYNPGRENLEADCLSRNPVLEGNEDDTDSSVIKVVNFVKLIDIIDDQKKLEINDKCDVYKNIVYIKLNNRRRIWLTENFGIELINKIHNTLGHVGIKQLELTIARKFYFKNLYKHIKSICRSCDTCIRNKTRFGNYKAPLSQLGPATRPFEIVSLDTIGGFGGNNSVKKYLHLLIDHFTRYAFLITSKTQEASDFIKIVKKIQNEEKIDTLLSDQYAGINSTEFKNYLKSEGINLIFTAVDCPFSNGQNERTNQTLVNRIRCKIYNNKNRAWSILADECVSEYNNTIHSSTGFTPNYLLTGVDNTFPRELTDNNLENLTENRKIAFENSKRAHDRNKSYYDLNSSILNYKEGDLVYIVAGSKLNRRKLDPIRSGPYEIKKKLSDHIYLIDSGFKKKESNLYHANKLVPYPSS